MIRFVVVNWNGGDRTLKCLRAIEAAEQPPNIESEIVLVDNASTDGVVEKVAAEFPSIRILRNSENLGFAGGVNTALRDLRGVDYVALVNNDAYVTPTWLAPLIDALRTDARRGAACPKILLDDQYLDLEISTSAERPGGLDSRELGVRVSAVRVADDDVWNRTRFVNGFYGIEFGSSGPYQWAGPQALIRVPAGADGPLPACELLLDANSPTLVSLRSGDIEKSHEVGTEPSWFAAPLDGIPFDVVNNIGTTLTRDAYGVDRGWLEIDEGQFEDSTDVFAWCGAAVLLSADYLRDVGLFDERLFMYSEDLELTWRGQEHGWRYTYVPTSVVRHEHAATSGEYSLRKTYFDERNHLLVVAMRGNARLIARVLWRYVAVTASYAIRDLAGPLVAGRETKPRVVRTRVAAFFSFLQALLPLKQKQA